MRLDIEGNDLLVVNQKFDGQSVAERDGDGVEALEFALRRVDAQGGHHHRHFSSMFGDDLRTFGQCFVDQLRELVLCFLNLPCCHANLPSVILARLARMHARF